MSPEDKARQGIDALLAAAGWAVQHYSQFALNAAPGIALRNVPLASGECDYLFLVDRQPVGGIETTRVGSTGAEMTLAICTFTYRLIKHAGAQRVFFLVDRAKACILL